MNIQCLTPCFPAGLALRGLGYTGRGGCVISEPLYKMSLNQKKVKVQSD